MHASRHENNHRVGMKKSSTRLSQGCHIPVVFVLTFAVVSPLMSIVMPKAAQLRSMERPGVALYFSILGVALSFIALLVLLPRRGNSSRIGVVRALGRLPLLVRSALIFLLVAGLFWLGILYESIAA
jgi:hypothetical protein